MLEDSHSRADAVTKVITPFAFGDNLVRVHTDEHGEPWFIAKDVALAMDYEWNGAARIAHVPEEWKGVTSVVTPGGTQEMLTLSEPGLNFFVFRSDKPKALPFQKWLAAEVLPTLRKTGSYTMPESNTYTPPKYVLSRAAHLLPARVKAQLMNNATQVAKSLDKMPDIKAIYADLCNTVASGTHGAKYISVGDVKSCKFSCLNAFIDECCEPDPEGPFLLDHDVLALHEQWCKFYGWKPLRCGPLLDGLASAFGATISRPRKPNHYSNRVRPLYLRGVKITCTVGI